MSLAKPLGGQIRRGLRDGRWGLVASGAAGGLALLAAVSLMLIAFGVTLLTTTALLCAISVGLLVGGGVVSRTGGRRRPLWPKTASDHRAEADRTDFESEPAGASGSLSKADRPDKPDWTFRRPRLRLSLGHLLLAGAILLGPFWISVAFAFLAKLPLSLARSLWLQFLVPLAVAVGVVGLPVMFLVGIVAAWMARGRSPETAPPTDRDRTEPDPTERGRTEKSARGAERGPQGHGASRA
ncbi:MAG TPA: hypothetical protein EYP14_11355, partial [Planctomycetaceae bacterium]|nr:hypothetical protein [Planctomycetaceae bacterium]